jgi:hypothetical protein
MDKDEILKNKKLTDINCKICGKPLTRIESANITETNPVNNLAPGMWGMDSTSEESLVCENPDCTNFQKVISNK